MAYQLKPAGQDPQIGGLYRYRVRYTRNGQQREKLFRQFGLASRFQQKQRMGSNPRMDLVTAQKKQR